MPIDILMPGVGADATHAGIARWTRNVGEAVRNPRSWADPLGGRNPKLGLNHPNGFGGPSKQQKTQFLMADGSVRTFTPVELEELIK